MTVKLIHGDISTRDENFTPINSVLAGSRLSSSAFFYPSTAFEGFHLSLSRRRTHCCPQQSRLLFMRSSFVCASSSQTIPDRCPSRRAELFTRKKSKRNPEIGNQLELRPTSKATLMCFLFKFTSRRTSREEQLTIAIKIEARGHRSDEQTFSF
jgi:hypothetical protein